MPQIQLADGPFTRGRGRSALASVDAFVDGSSKSGETQPLIELSPGVDSVAVEEDEVELSALWPKVIAELSARRARARDLPRRHHARSLDAARRRSRLDALRQRIARARQGGAAAGN